MKYHVKFNCDLRKNPYKGLYIAFEGIDGCGKSTQIEKIAKYLQKKGKKVVVTHEPRKKGSIIGKLIEKILSAKVKFPLSSFQNLYSSERSLNHAEIVEPALKKGQIVLTHRSNWSTIPYGVFDKGKVDGRVNEKTANLIMAANGLLSFYHQFIIPDITIYLKVSPKTAVKRMKEMGKKREIYEEERKLRKVIKGYNWLLRKFPKNITMISGESEEKRVTQKIIDIIEKKLS